MKQALCTKVSTIYYYYTAFSELETRPWSFCCRIAKRSSLLAFGLFLMTAEAVVVAWTRSGPETGDSPAFLGTAYTVPLMVTSVVALPPGRIWPYTLASSPSSLAGLVVTVAVAAAGAGLSCPGSGAPWLPAVPFC